MTTENPHLFIFNQSEWEGEGIISFSISPEKIKFKTRWEVHPKQNEKINCVQVVQMEDVDDYVSNFLNFSQLSMGEFIVELENESIGHVKGTGLYDSEKISWEFRGHPRFEGFEVYRIRDDGSYDVHAEFASGQNVRTLIEGHIWKK